MTNENTSRLSSIRSGGICPLAVYPKSIEELIGLIIFALNKDIGFRVLGDFTNTFFSSEVKSCILISTRNIRGYRILTNSGFEALCGERITFLIRRLAVEGIEFAPSLYGIPGTIGGALYNNAGAFGCSIGNHLKCAELFDIELRKTVLFDNTDFEFGYRNSILQKRRHILLRAVFQCWSCDKIKIFEELNQIIAKRRSLHPNKPSLGSFFKRDGDVVPPMLIDKLGLKGSRVGDAAVSEKHSGFIVNLGNALPQDILELASNIETKVYNAYGVILKREAEYIE